MWFLSKSSEVEKPKNPGRVLLRIFLSTFSIFFPGRPGKMEILIGFFSNSATTQRRILTTDFVEIKICIHKSGVYYRNIWSFDQETHYLETRKCRMKKNAILN